MSKDPFYKFCSRCGDFRKVEWHHTIIFASKQLQEKWAIVPACQDCHKQVGQDKNVKQYFEWIALRRATDKELQAISKVINYFRLKALLNKKYEQNGLITKALTTNEEAVSIVKDMQDKIKKANS